MYKTNSESQLLLFYQGVSPAYYPSMHIFLHAPILYNSTCKQWNYQLVDYKKLLNWKIPTLLPRYRLFHLKADIYLETYIIFPLQDLQTIFRAACALQEHFYYAFIQFSFGVEEEFMTWLWTKVWVSFVEVVVEYMICINVISGANLGISKLGRKITLPIVLEQDS